MSQAIFNSDRAPEAVGPYPHARRIGSLLFLSGIGPRERNQKKIPGVEQDETGKSYEEARKKPARGQEARRG